MAGLELLERQPGFPIEDLTDSNAEFLSLMLSNDFILQNGHIGAETSHPIFTGTHRPLMLASDNLYDDPDRIRPINYGILAFESMTYLVGADQQKANTDALQGNIARIINPQNIPGVQEYFDKAYADFCDDLPNTAKVIHDSARRRFGSTTLTVLGGAIARQFEIDNID